MAPPNPPRTGNALGKAPSALLLEPSIPCTSGSRALRLRAREEVDTEAPRPPAFSCTTHQLSQVPLGLLSLQHYGSKYLMTDVF